VTNVDRSIRARINEVRARINEIISGTPRRRVQAITAGAALAVVTGIAAPAFVANAAESTPASAVTATRADTVAASALAKLMGQAPASSFSKADVAKKVEAKKAAEKKKATVKAPTYKQLHPRGISGEQQTFKPTTEQLKNAREIVKAGKKMKLKPRAMVIAMATALQESTMKNLGHLGDRNDHDSQGLFQQRPSSGWGTVKQITTPSYAATAFYKALVNVDGWDKMKLTEAAQTVQVSAFPDHYAKWEKHAGDLVEAFYGAGPYAKQAAALK